MANSAHQTKSSEKSSPNASAKSPDENGSTAFEKNTQSKKTAQSMEVIMVRWILLGGALLLTGWWYRHQKRSVRGPMFVEEAFLFV